MILFVLYVYNLLINRLLQFVVIIFVKFVFKNIFYISLYHKKKCPQCKRKIRYLTGFSKSKDFDTLIEKVV